MSERIFVFGSNKAGIHGAGAAKYAFEHLGAQWGVGEGRTGQAYALPTKDYNIKTLRFTEVREAIKRFADYARDNPHLTFELTPVGCGLAGFDVKNIKGLLQTVSLPTNIVLSLSWLEHF